MLRDLADYIGSRTASPSSTRTALRIAGAYAVAGAAWIAGSDELLEATISSYGGLSTLQTYKGWAFVAVTAALLFVFVRISWARVHASHRATEKSHDRLELALESARGGVWDRDLVEGHMYISPQIKALIGFEDSEFPNSRGHWSERIHPNDLPIVRDRTKQAITDPLRWRYDLQYRIRHRDGSFRWLHSRAKVLTDASGSPVRMVGVLLDITAQVNAQQDLAHLMRHDPVTGLPNRNAFVETLDELLALPESKRKKVLVARIDVDHFKHVNDRFGADGGDKVLRSVGERLRRAAGYGATIGHVAGDEFAVAVPGVEHSKRAQQLVRSISAAFNNPVLLDGTEVPLSVSIGATLHPDDGSTAEDLLKGAVIALSTARQKGLGKTRFFAAGMDQEFRLHAARVQDLRYAGKRGDLEVHYQPIVGIPLGNTIGFEALVRWRRSGEGLVPPDHFIGLAEEAGFIGEIGETVLRRACLDAVSWTGHGNDQAYVAVNVSPLQFDDPEFGMRVRRALDESGLHPARLELEVTETALARDPEAAREWMEALRQMGVSIAIDDFGTGYSSLGALQRLPLSRLKIDRSFVSGAKARDGDNPIADTILTLANAFAIPALAEGVETFAQLEAMARKGAKAVQGYYFSRPVTHDQVPAMLDRQWLDWETAADCVPLRQHGAP